VKYAHQKLLEKAVYTGGIAGILLWEAFSKNLVTVLCAPVHLGYLIMLVCVNRSVMTWLLDLAFVRDWERTDSQ